MPDSDSAMTEEQYIERIKYSIAQKFFEFDPGRPPKNVDIVKFVVSRTKCKTVKR